MKEPISIYRKHMRPPQYQQLAFEKDLRTCGDGTFHMFHDFTRKCNTQKILSGLLNR